MPRSTTNVSMRIERPMKALRRTPVDQGENDDANQSAGASGQATHARRRPGRAASLRSSAARTRSQRWRVPKKGKRKLRKGNLAKGSRTGRNRSAGA
jgi:hypothetical protein